MKNRVLGFWENEKGNKSPIAFFHTDSRGLSCMNGNRSRIILVPPGTMELPYEKTSAACLSKEVFPIAPGTFIRFSGDDVLLECRSVEKARPCCEVIKSGFVKVSEEVEIWPPLHSGILTVSDKGSRGQRQDTSGPALAEALALIGAIPVKTMIVPDEKDEIESVLNTWTTGENALDIILTTGGTGLAGRDTTPEAISELPGKDVPGLGEYMRLKTSAFTIRSILSRSTARVVGRSLIVALPGSKRGALQCFHAVAPVIRHAVEIASGRGGECGGHHGR